MSPLVNSPLRGYADWQRIDNYDSGALFSESAAPHNGAWNTPAIDVSRYAYLGGYVSVAGVNVSATFRWYIDAALTTQVGERDIAYNSAVTGKQQFRIQNMGPFLQVAFTTITGASSVTQTLFGTNRVHPLEFIPATGYIWSEVNHSVNTGGVLGVTPTAMYAGPANLFWFSTVANWGVQIFQLVPFGTDALLWSVNTVAGNQNYQIVCPLPSWYVLVANNTGGTNSYDLAITPSITGST